MTRAFDVVAIGELNPDLIISGIAATSPVLGTEQAFESQTLTLGSSTAIACVLMQRLGLRTAMSALVGDDEHGRFCLDALDREGVDRSAVRIRPDRTTGLTISLSYDHDRLLLTRYGTMTEFGTTDIDGKLLRSARHVHCGSFFLQTALRPDLPAIFREARSHGATTSLDPGWDPSGLWNRAALEAVLPEVDVFLPNRVELLGITGCGTVEQALTVLHGMGAAEIVVKLGADGSLVSAGGAIQRRPGRPIVVVDTTGAGDAFNAGYIHARVSGKSAEERLALGNACGALVAMARGGTAGLQDLAQAEDLMRT